MKHCCLPSTVECEQKAACFWVLVRLSADIGPPSAQVGIQAHFAIFHWRPRRHRRRPKRTSPAYSSAWRTFWSSASGRCCWAWMRWTSACRQVAMADACPTGCAVVLKCLKEGSAACRTFFVDRALCMFLNSACHLSVLASMHVLD